MNLETCYIVHYTKLTDRKEKLLTFLESTPLRYEFINELDKEDLTDDIINQIYDTNTNTFNLKVTNLWNGTPFSYLNLAQISCTIKHISALKKIAEGDEPFGLILEDDAIPVSEDYKNVYERINDVISKLPEDWDSVFLGLGCGHEFIQERIVGLEVKDNLVKARHPATNCAEAYIIKKESAQKIVKDIIPFGLISDWELAYQFYKFNMNVYWTLDPLFIQGTHTGYFKSTLNQN